MSLVPNDMTITISHRAQYGRGPLGPSMTQWGGMGWSLRALAKGVGVSTASVARGTESGKNSCVTGECYLTFRVFIGLTKFSK